jgi:hypothetical protein
VKLSEAFNWPREWGDVFQRRLTDVLRLLTKRVNTMLDVPLRLGGTTNYVEIESDGTLAFYGTATVWDDLLGAAINLRAQGPGVSTNITENQVEFTTASDLNDYLLDSQQLSHSWDGGAIYPHLHAWQTTSAAPNWLLQYRWQKMNAAKVTSWTYLKCNTPAFTYPGSGTFHQLFGTAAGITPPSGAGISDILQFRVLRDNANGSGVFTGADPVAATAAISSFDTHYAKNTLGSRSITTK